MGALAVLHPQDPLKKQHKTLTNSHMEPPQNPNPKPTRSNCRKRSPGKENNTSGNSFPVKNLVMGQVRILKRGEELAVLKDQDEKPPPPKEDARVSDELLSRLGPEPEMVPKQMRVGDMYAGLGFGDSPPPSSLPLPAFLSNKKNLSGKKDDDARTHVRRVRFQFD